MGKVKGFFANLGAAILQFIIAVVVCFIFIIVASGGEMSGGALAFTFLQVFIYPVVSVLLFLALVVGDSYGKKATVLKFISMGLSMFLCVFGLFFYAIYFNELKEDNNFNIAFASLVTMWPLSYILLFYAYDRFGTEKYVFAASPATMLISFVVNLLIALLGNVSEFFWSWFPFILYMVVYVVLFLVRRKNNSIFLKVNFLPNRDDARCVRGNTQLKVRRTHVIKEYPKFKWDGGIFDYWSTDQFGAGKWENCFTVTEDMNLYAIWKQVIMDVDVSSTSYQTTSYEEQKLKQAYWKLKAAIKGVFNDKSTVFGDDLACYCTLARIPKVSISANLKKITITDVEYFYDYDLAKKNNVSPQFTITDTPATVRLTIEKNVKEALRSYDEWNGFEICCTDPLYIEVNADY